MSVVLAVVGRSRERERGNEDRSEEIGPGGRRKKRNVSAETGWCRINLLKKDWKRIISLKKKIPSKTVQLGLTRSFPFQNFIPFRDQNLVGKKERGGRGGGGKP